MSKLSRPRAGDTTFDAIRYALPYAPGVERHFWNVARNRIVERHLRRALATQRRSDRLVLDVGCGPGIVVDHLRRAGIDCHGVELGKPAVRPGIERYVSVCIDAADLTQDIRERTGTILLLDVVEHIEHPKEFISGLLAAYTLLEHIIITVPARMELWSNYDRYYGHFLRYDKAKLRALATACALDVVELKYFFVSLYPVMRSMIRRSQARPLETTPPSSALAIGLHALVGRAFAMEERVSFTGALPGTSLLAVLSRRAG
jgi:SAM-dependent methyltransferase